MQGFELGLDDGEIGAGLIGLAQRRSGTGILGHVAMLPEDG
jgi:hypothetical protein